MHPLLRLWLKIIGIGIGALVALLVLPIVFVAIVLPDACDNSLIAEIPSPSGEEKAVVFTRDCGATTDFSTQVSVIKASRKLPNSAGNIFVADRDNQEAPAGKAGGPEIKVSWVAPRRVRIEHHELARVFKAEQVHSGITIEYSLYR